MNKNDIENDIELDYNKLYTLYEKGHSLGVYKLTKEGYLRCILSNGHYHQGYEWVVFTYITNNKYYFDNRIPNWIIEEL